MVTAQLYSRKFNEEFNFSGLADRQAYAGKQKIDVI